MTVACFYQNSKGEILYGVTFIAEYLEEHPNDYLVRHYSYNNHTHKWLVNLFYHKNNKAKPVLSPVNTTDPQELAILKQFATMERDLANK